MTDKKLEEGMEETVRVITKFYPHFVLRTEGKIRKNKGASWTDVAKDFLSGDDGYYAISIETPLFARRQQDRQMQALQHQRRYYRGTRVLTIDEARKSPQRDKLLKGINAHIHTGVVVCGDQCFPLYDKDIVFVKEDGELKCVVDSKVPEEQSLDNKPAKPRPLAPPIVKKRGERSF